MTCGGHAAIQHYSWSSDQHLAGFHDRNVSSKEGGPGYDNVTIGRTHTVGGANAGTQFTFTAIHSHWASPHRRSGMKSVSSIERLYGQLRSVLRVALTGSALTSQGAREMMPRRLQVHRHPIYAEQYSNGDTHFDNGSRPLSHRGRHHRGAVLRYGIRHHQRRSPHGIGASRSDRQLGYFVWPGWLCHSQRGMGGKTAEFARMASYL
jgi:hypothetical protein